MFSNALVFFIDRNLVPRQGTKTVSFVQVSSAQVRQKLSSPVGDENEVEPIHIFIISSDRNLVPRQGTKTHVIFLASGNVNLIETQFPGRGRKRSQLCYSYSRRDRNLVPRQGTKTKKNISYTHQNCAGQKLSSPVGDENEVEPIHIFIISSDRNLVPRQGTKTHVIFLASGNVNLIETQFPGRGRKRSQLCYSYSRRDRNLVPRQGTKTKKNISYTHQNCAGQKLSSPVGDENSTQCSCLMFFRYWIETQFPGRGRKLLPDSVYKRRAR